MRKSKEDEKKYQHEYYMKNKERLTEYKKEYQSKRNYTKEYENEKNSIKRYTVRVPLYKAQLLDEKLKRDNLTYSKIALEAIEKYLRKK